MRTNTAILIATVSLGCAARQPELPEPIDFGGLHEHRRQPVSVAGVDLESIFVFERPIGGIAAEQRNLPVIDLIGAIDGDGRLYMTDVVHETGGRAAYRYAKIDRSQIRLESAQGQFEPDGLTFTPNLDPLVALDSGYAIRVAINDVADQVTFRPLYDSALYAPYSATGLTPGPGEPGESGSVTTRDVSFDGADGEHGKDDSPDGADGADGAGGAKPSQRGGDGGNGGDGDDGNIAANGGNAGHGGSGGDGHAATHGQRGTNGQPGDRGPRLDVLLRPAYSKFYPDETLVFIQVVATWPDGRESQRRYIIHAEQPFAITSAGGNGGDGGRGGRGGDGGDGGDGGGGGSGGHGGPGDSSANAPAGSLDGGDGGRGGNGGRGGSGGRNARGGDGGDGGHGGDGGPIFIEFGPGADRAFQRATQANLLIRSVGGGGGAGGRPGDNGRPGGPGSGGDRGSGGQPGAPATNGQWGTRGDDGEGGDGGSWGEAIAAPGGVGRIGQDGRGGEMKWR